MNSSSSVKIWRLEDRYWSLVVQSAVSRVACVVIYPFVVGFLRYGRKYRIDDLRGVREQFSELLAQAGDDPLLICANHLTMIDSAVIMWALSPAWKCMVTSRRFPWNLPERTIFADRKWRAAALYVARCLPIVRHGPPGQSRRVLEKVMELLNQGDSVLMFPEGGRSRIGKIDVENFSYGVGMIAQRVPRLHVACVFSRGRGQEAYTAIPAKRERFFVRLARVQPVTSSRGTRAVREMAHQVIDTLAGLEKEYFGEVHRADGTPKHV